MKQIKLISAIEYKHRKKKKKITQTNLLDQIPRAPVGLCPGEQYKRGKIELGFSK